MFCLSNYLVSFWTVCILLQTQNEKKGLVLSCEVTSQD